MPIGAAAAADSSARSVTCAGGITAALYHAYNPSMKIIRLKRGYRISLNDGEFEALSLLVEHGKDVQQEEGGAFLAHVSPAAKRAFKGRFALREPMEVDEDRRR
jgi:hypothetical protein